MRGLEFHQHERQAIHEGDQIRAPIMHLACYLELRYEQEIVISWRVPVDDAYRLIEFWFCIALSAHLDLDAILEQTVYLAVGVNGTERAAVSRHIRNRQLDSLARHARIKFAQRGAQARPQHNLVQRLASQHAALARLLSKRIDGLVAKPGE